VASIYIESTIPSYLASHPSANLVTAAHQLVTQEWWATASRRFDLFVSDAVIGEIAQGDPNMATRRLEIVSQLPVLPNSPDVDELIRTYHAHLGLTGSATADLPHFAYAVAYGMDYMVTWNCAHIANAQVVKKLFQVNVELGRSTPLIVTPLELADDDTSA
jgi:hypothetical protein